MTPEAFEERRRDLEKLLGELRHCLWERGVPAPSAAAEAPSDDAAFVSTLLEQLRNHTMPAGRKSTVLVAGILFRATEARLRMFALLGEHLSELERRSLAELLRLPATERRTIAALLRLSELERAELAVVLQLADVEDEALAAFLDDGEAAIVSMGPRARSRDGAARKATARRISGEPP